MVTSGISVSVTSITLRSLEASIVEVGDALLSTALGLADAEASKLGEALSSDSESLHPASANEITAMLSPAASLRRVS